MKRNDYFKGMMAGFLATFALITMIVIGWFVYNITRFGFGDNKLNINELTIGAKVSAVEALINSKYLFEVDSQQVEDFIFKGMVTGLGDKYAVYYSPEEFKKQMESADGKFIGIGITYVDVDGQGMKVTKVYEGLAAEKAGIKINDLITKIDGKEYSSMKADEYEKYIQDKENQDITVTIYREETGETMDIQVEVKDNVKPTISGSMLENNTGYIRIDSFINPTCQQFKEKYEELKASGMKKIIIDVRDNPGGYINSVSGILDYLISNKVIYSIKDSKGNERVYKTEEGGVLDIPCIVLANESSASSSELFTAALKDNGLAKVVGVKTFGKGIVQTTFRLMDGSAVKLTTEQYFSPNGDVIHQKGIEPDYEVANEKDSSDDIQLKKALEVLEGE